MTPHLTLSVSPGSQFDSQDLTTAHLTEEQFGELLANISSPASATAEAHLLACNQCAAEFVELRESLSLFRQASNAYANNELRRLPPVSLHPQGVLAPAFAPMYWAAAAALFLAAILPIQSLRQHYLHTAQAASAGVPQNTAQSDEALLEAVDSYTSAAVPAPMQVLADPTLSSNGITPTSQNSDQRKD